MKQGEQIIVKPREFFAAAFLKSPAANQEKVQVLVRALTTPTHKDTGDAFRDHRELQLGTMEKRTAAEFKVWLKKSKLPISGRKADLIQRRKQAIASEH